jgi:hypothetical protein
MEKNIGSYRRAADRSRHPFLLHPRFTLAWGSIPSLEGFQVVDGSEYPPDDLRNRCRGVSEAGDPFPAFVLLFSSEMAPADISMLTLVLMQAEPRHRNPHISYGAAVESVSRASSRRSIPPSGTNGPGHDSEVHYEEHDRRRMKTLVFFPPVLPYKCTFLMFRSQF